MSADYDLVSDISPMLGLVLATRDADASTPAVDTRDWKSVTLGFYLGIGGITFSSTNRIDVRVQESENNSDWSNVAEDDLVLPYGLTYGAANSGIVKSYVALKGAADTNWSLVGYRGKMRYARLTFDFGGTHGAGTPCAAIVIQGHPARRPAWQSSIEV